MNTTGITPMMNESGTLGVNGLLRTFILFPARGGQTGTRAMTRVAIARGFGRTQLIRRTRLGLSGAIDRARFPISPKSNSFNFGIA